MLSKFVVFVTSFLIMFGQSAQAIVPDYVNRLTQSLQKANISVVEIKDKNNELCENIAGLYEPDKRTITICPVSLSNRDEYLSTLSHETVHVIQHLGGNPLVVDRIGIELPPSVYKLVDSLDYPSIVRDIEAEAWTLQNYPSIVLDMLNRIINVPTKVEFGVRNESI